MYVWHSNAYSLRRLACLRVDDFIDQSLLKQINFLGDTETPAHAYKGVGVSGITLLQMNPFLL